MTETRRKKLHDTIFESNTNSGKVFDIFLIIAILISVVAVILESVPSIAVLYGHELQVIEWLFTIIFTVEYFFRLLAVQSPRRYALSFFGLVDLLAFLPSYISLFLGGAQIFLVLRILRLLRFFRVFKLARYISEADILVRALRASRPKIIVFIFTLTTLTILFGSLMHIVENGTPGFESIPSSIYWAVVTMTTVGFGDITPYTVFGKFIASILMIVGYGVIAVPTGIVTFELSRTFGHLQPSSQACRACGKEGHDKDAKFCKFCGGQI